MDRPLLPLVEKHQNIFNDLPDLHSIDLYPDTIDRLKASQNLLHDKPCVKYLCISNAFEYSNEDPDDLHDSSTRPGLFSRTLFSHMQPFDRCEPMTLRSLELDTICLRVSRLTVVCRSALRYTFRLNIEDHSHDLLAVALYVPYSRNFACVIKLD